MSVNGEDGRDIRIPEAFPAVGRVAGKTVVITGASRGLGRVLAHAFSRLEARVAIVARSKEGLLRVSAALDGPTLVFPGDVTDEAFNEEVADAVVSEWGALDVWISNAGISPMLAGTLETDINRFRRILDVNVTGAFLGAKAAARVMTEGGRLIFTGSVLGERGHPSLSAYAASKGALTALVKSLAADLGPRGITVNAVTPGWFVSPMADGWVGDEKREQEVLSHTVLLRWGAAMDLPGAYLFLASDASAFVTGGTINVDGGYLAI